MKAQTIAVGIGLLSAGALGFSTALAVTTPGPDVSHVAESKVEGVAYDSYRDGYLHAVDDAGLVPCASGDDAACIEVPSWLEPCAYEDSDNCYWDAQASGNGEGESFIASGDEVTYIEREPVSVLPAPEPTPTPTVEPTEATVAPATLEAPKTLPATPTPTPESLCDPEITDLHCDPETGEYWDDAPMECIPDGYLSEGAVAPVGVPMCND